MYEALIAHLRECAELDPSNNTYTEATDAIETMREMVATAHDELANVIQSYEESKPRWIPVTERLPKYGDWVLGIGPKHGYHICEYRGITHFPYSGDSPWFSAKGRTLTITHWMPLPEPPKEGTYGN